MKYHRRSRGRLRRSQNNPQPGSKLYSESLPRTLWTFVEHQLRTSQSPAVESWRGRTCHGVAEGAQSMLMPLGVTPRSNCCYCAARRREEKRKRRWCEINSETGRQASNYSVKPICIIYSTRHPGAKRNVESWPAKLAMRSEKKMRVPKLLLTHRQWAPIAHPSTCKSCLPEM